MLKIRTLAENKPRERRIVPACIQPRAPHDYEIRYATSDEPAPLSLVGYILTPGTEYKLFVTSSQENASEFKLDFRTPMRIAQPLDDESVPQGNSRYVTFDLNSNPTGIGKVHPLLQMTEMSTLTARILYCDNRDPFDLEIPIVVTRNPALGILSLFSPAVIGVGTELIVNQTVPNFWQIFKLALLGIAIWIALFIIDNFRLWRKARLEKMAVTPILVDAEGPGVSVTPTAQIQGG